MFLVVILCPQAPSKLTATSGGAFRSLELLSPAMPLLSLYKLVYNPRRAMPTSGVIDPLSDACLSLDATAARPNLTPP